MRDAKALRWQVSYEQASVDRFLAEVDAERARLHSEIEATRSDVQQMQVAAAAQAARHAELAGRFLSVQKELEAIEREHWRTIAAIGAGAENAAEHLLAAAREEAEAMSAVAASLIAGAKAPGMDVASSRPAIDLRNDQ